MKRKLFTLLAAFVALVAFQANAQTTWYYIDTKSPTESNNPAYSGSGWTSAIDWIACGGSIYDSELNGSLRVSALNAPFKNETQYGVGGSLGDFASYFTFEPVGGSTYKIKSRKSDDYLKLTYGGFTYETFEFIQFGNPPGVGWCGAFPTAYSGNTITAVQGFANAPACAVAPTAGGYLCLPSASTNAGPLDRVYVVVDRNTGALQFMDVKQIFDSNTGANVGRYSRLWAKFFAYGGRWATPNDFKNTDFVKFNIDGTTLSAKDYAAAGNNPSNAVSYDVFRVTAVSEIPSFLSGNHAVWGNSDIVGDWLGGPGGSTTTGLYYNGSDWVLPLFTIRAADDACKYLSVKKENWVYDNSSAIKSPYSDKLELRTYGQYFENMDPSVSDGYRTSSLLTPDLRNLDQLVSPTPVSGIERTETERSIGTQTWAIWIDDEGQMSLYPLDAYVFDMTMAKSGANVGTGNNMPYETGQNSQNRCLLYNKPVTTSSDDGVYQGFCYKVGTRIDGQYADHYGPNDYCLVPSLANPAPTYANLHFMPQDWNNHNALPGTGRYFWIEAKGQTGVQAGHVLAVVSIKNNLQSGANIGWYKKLVLIKKESVATNAADYSVHGLDSVILSAHWEAITVKDASNEVLGYRFVNEVGDTLKYWGDNPYITSATSAPEVYTMLSGGADMLLAVANSNGRGNKTRFDHNSFPNWVHGKYYWKWAPAFPGFTPSGTTVNGVIPNTSMFLFKTDPMYNSWQDYKDGTDKFIPLDVWKTIKSKSSTDPYFVLRLNNYLGVPGTWANAQVNLDIWDAGTTSTSGLYTPGTVTSGTNLGYYNAGKALRVSGVANGVANAFYYQRDVVAKPYFPNVYPAFGDACTNGIEFKVTPVEYGPYSTATVKPITYTDASNPDYYYQDSLTNYMYNAGSYNIKEALDLTLNIGASGEIVSMVEAEQSDIVVEPVGGERDAILALAGQTLSDGVVASIDNLTADALYSDPYKWHYIKKGNKYLTFGVINPAALSPDLMYGFLFSATDKLNATPIRFYQPLVGDKAYRNFIIQFIVPTYHYGFVGGAVDASQTYHISYVGGGDPDLYPAAIRFAKFNRQTGPLYVTADVKTKATRFRFTQVGEPPCHQEFVTTDYLIDNGMYRLPVTAEVYLSGEKTNFFIAADAIEKENLSSAAKLTFTLAETLYAANPSASLQAGLGDRTNTTANNFYQGFSQGGSGFSGDPYQTTRKDVQLFYIQNEAGQYLTVTNTTVASQNLSGVTNPDVYGGKLQFINTKYTKANTGTTYGGKDPRPLQMFAIFGCTSTEAPYGEFILLPAASYIYNYATGGVFQAAPVTNPNLGVYTASGLLDVSGAYRITHYNKNSYQLIVAPGKSAENTSATADEFKLTRYGTYAGPFCYHNFVRSGNTGSTIYYGALNSAGQSGNASFADYTNPRIHWQIDPVANKESVYTFTSELQSWRGATYTNPADLTGEFYFVQATGSDFNANKVGTFEIFTRSNPDVVRQITVNCIDEAPYDAVCDDPDDANAWKVCTDHYYRFCDETLMLQQFGIIEALYNDRYIWDGVEAISDNDPKTTETIAKKLEEGGTAEYLDIIKSWTRPISEHHSIPYYNIARYIDGKAYYLEVVNDPATKQPTDVRFRELTDLELDTLSKYDLYPNALPGLKFCFPYRLDENGNRVLAPKYRDQGFHQVYIQTLDTGYYSSTMLHANVLKINADSRTIDARQLSDDDILTIDYRDDNKLQATTWFFGDNDGADYDWVELWGVKNEGADKSTKGWLTGASNDKPGTMYVTASGATPVNYGLLKVFSQAGAAELTFEFEGYTTIGSYNPKPIWYYRIKNADGKYLTSAVPNMADPNFCWSEDKPYAYFGTKLANAAANAPITADAKYDQTFGLRHVPVSMQGVGDKEKFYFWVVSRVDYKNPASTEYYYLSQINDRLVFSKADLKDPTKVLETAMMFQLGGVDANGNYTDVEEVTDGATKVYGIDGAVKVVNAAGVVELYTIDGRKFNTVVADGTEQVIAAPRGVVIVKNGGNVEKVIVK
ncbi:MAG: DUF6383 domain-containing protein [Dysgonamonadaceae bacterium]|jgi:hypothetical protein|nr:DUF6383 domain-containing protein [Dysgonamonadaceae bacterium]